MGASRCFAFAMALLLPLALAVQPTELVIWFQSPQGLNMTKTDATALAQKEWVALTQSGMTIPKLQALRDAMVGNLGMDVLAVHQHILLLSEQHATPSKLSKFFEALSSSYTISGGLQLPTTDAQMRAIQMSSLRVEVDQLYALFKVMYGWGGLGFNKGVAQDWSLQLCLAGADAATFQNQYTQAKALGLSDADAIASAAIASVNDNLEGEVRRYAKDARPYTSVEFQQHYGSAAWLSEWLAAPQEEHISSDGLAHTAGQYQKNQGSSWRYNWQATSEAIQVRLAQDGQAYNMDEYQQHYSDAWQQRWDQSPELPCTRCFPFTKGPSIEAVAGSELLV